MRARPSRQNPQPKRQPNGKWKIWYRDEHGARKTRTYEASSEQEARQIALAIIRPINEATGPPGDQARTFDDLIYAWRESVAPSLRTSTQQHYEWAFKKILAHWRQVQVQRVGRHDVLKFLVSHIDTLSPVSLHNLRTYLSGLFTVAEEWAWITSNPAKGRFKGLPAAEPVRTKLILTPQEFQNLVFALEMPYSTMVTIAVLTGLRRGEIAALRWDDISDEHIRVDESVYYGVLSPPKTTKSRRRVPVGAGLKVALDEWHKVAPFTGPRDFVFAQVTNTPARMENVVRRHVKPACRRLGMKPFSWHYMRHTYVTWGRKAKVEPEVMQSMLGHRDVQTTLNIYSHLDEVTEGTSTASSIESVAFGKEPKSLQ